MTSSSLELSFEPSSSPAKEEPNQNHSAASFLPSPIASPSPLSIHTFSPHTSTPSPNRSPEHCKRDPAKVFMSAVDASMLMDVDEPVFCNPPLKIQKNPVQAFNDGFIPPLPKKRTVVAPSIINRPDTSRKRRRDPAKTPPGLDIVKKRRKTEKSLYMNKYERQSHLYLGTNESWVGSSSRPTGGEWMPNSINAYKNLKQIGSGVYGSVYKGEAPTGKAVALKFLRLENERDGLPITAVREIKLLKHMNHPNVIKLLDMVTSKKMEKGSRKKADIYMALEWCDHDLAGLLHNPEFKFSETTVKHFMSQIMEGFKYLHSGMGTLHRDVKPANILVNSNGTIKLADFGLARVFDNKRALTNGHRIVTRWYRSPELLLGSQKYDYSIDMWSVGCVFGELITRKPIFPAREEIHQLGVVMDLCGSFDVKEWPEALEFAGLPKKPCKRRLESYFRNAMEQKRWGRDNINAALDLLDRLLQMTPSKRLRAADGSVHRYFSCKPHAVAPILPSESHHEWKYNKSRPSHHRPVNGKTTNRSLKQPLPHRHRRHHAKSDFKHDFEQRFKPQVQRKPVRDQRHRHKPNRQHQMGFFDYGAIDYGI